MATPPPADAAIARALAQLPVLRQWSNQPLDRHVRRMIDQADMQTLLSIAVTALDRATRFGDADNEQ